MDLFTSSELILTDLIPPEATYTAPDGTLLARIVRTDGMVARKRKRGNPFKGMFTRRNAVEDPGLVALRVEDLTGRSLLTLTGASGSICEVRDADGAKLGRFEHDNELYNRTWAASLLDRHTEWQHYFRGWAVISPAGKTILEIHTNEFKSRRRNMITTHFGGDVRTVTTPDATQVAVWTDEKLTFERELPSALRDLVLAMPMAIKMINPEAFTARPESMDDYVWERP
jgi:hypothetical protein